jgi:hydroxymethylpyrimidine/phosphomethylpyrimidine kinase
LGEVIAIDVMDQIAKAYNNGKVPDPVMSNEAQEKLLNEHFSNLRVLALKQAYALPEFQPNFLEAKINAYTNLDSAQKKALLDELYKQKQIRMLGNSTGNAKPK